MMMPSNTSSTSTAKIGRYPLKMSMMPSKSRMPSSRKASNASNTTTAITGRFHIAYDCKCRSSGRGRSGGRRLVSFRPGSGNRGSGPSSSSGGMAPISRREQKATGQSQPQAARSRSARAKTAGPTASGCPQSGSQDARPDLDTFPEGLPAAQPRCSP
jgi:hypothetical protein